MEFGDIKKAQMNGWVYDYSDARILFNSTLVAQGLGLIKEWKNHFTREDTWVQRELSLPSIIVRIDCTVIGGNMATYEVEERPSGIGVTSLFNPDFAEALSKVRLTWPDITVAVSPERAGFLPDDSVWTKTKIGPKIDEGNALVRAEPEETEFDCLVPFSISSVRAKGDKSYGVPMGLWSEVDSNSDLPWEDGFALKPLQGSKARGIHIWMPKREAGAVTRTKILNALERGRMYCQPLLPPIETGVEQYSKMIYRVFYGYDIEQLRWSCLGGSWTARNNMKIHGATDSLVGPLVI